MKPLQITEPLVRKLLETVDAGLVCGLGEPIPGQMCVEAAVSYALGEPHSDGPSCVEPCVRFGKIRLNDCAWSSPAARAKGMRQVAIAQLGSMGVVNPTKYVTLLAELTIREIVPIGLRAAAALIPSHVLELERAALRCEHQGSYDAAYASYAAARASYAASADAAARAAADAASYASSASDAASAASAAARSADAAAYAAYSAAADSSDVVLSKMADIMVRVLKECGSPGCDWLWLTE